MCRSFYLILVLFWFKTAYAQHFQPRQISILDASKAGIMGAIFRNYNGREKSSKWLCTDKDLLKTFALTTNSRFVSKMLYADSLAEGKSQLLNVLVSINSADDGADCHACAPVLEFFCFEKEGPLWWLKYCSITEKIGSYGAAPPFEVKIIGMGKVGFLFSPGYTTQGVDESGFVLFAADKQAFRELLNISGASGDNSGLCDIKVANSCYSYDGKIKILNTGKAYYDILLTKKGTDLKNGRVIKIDSVITYRFVNGRYVR